MVNGYLLPLSALLLLGGAAGDRWGRRPLLLAGILVFGIASLGCALAPGLPTLVVARFVQGCGAAMLMPTSLAVLGDTFSGEARGRAIGIWAATGAIAGAVGPVLGGVLVDAVGWRAVFLINLPLAAAALRLAIRSVPASTARSGHELDISGALLATAGLGLVSWGLTEGSGRGSWSMFAVGATATGLLALLLFLVVERRRGNKAMMPLAMFGSATFTGLTLLTLLVYGALGGLFVLLPFVLIQAGGYSASLAGAALLPLPLLLALLSPLAGSLAGRLGPRLPLTIGPAIVALAQSARVQAERGAIWPGNARDGCMVVLDGAIDLVRSQPFGDEVLIASLGRGQLTGEIGQLSGGTTLALGRAGPAGRKAHCFGSPHLPATGARER